MHFSIPLQAIGGVYFVLTVSPMLQRGTSFSSKYPRAPYGLKSEQQSWLKSTQARRALQELPQGRGKIPSYFVKSLRISSLKLKKFASSERYFAHGFC